MARPLRFFPVPVALILLVVWQGVFALHVMISDVLDFSVQREMVFWGVKGKIPTPEEVGDALAKMTRALELWPQNPDYLALHARLHVWQGQIATSKPAANAQFKLALASMHQSLVVRPGNPYSWAQYAEYLSTQRDRKIEMLLAIERVRTLGKGELGLQKRMQVLVRN